MIQEKTAHDYVYVSTGSMVVGIEPEDIVEFDPYWSYFSWYFRDALRGQEATCFSSLWRFDKPWAELTRLRREAGLITG